MPIKIHWQEGLFLQPHHLQRMQKGIADEIVSERQLTWPYPYGLIEARVNHAALANKKVIFDKLRALMPSGIEVNYPTDAELPSLDITQVFSRGSGSFLVYLGVPLWQNKAANTVTHDGDSRARLLYRIGETECPDENTGENPKPIQIRKINSRLILDPDEGRDMEFLPLLRIVRGTGDAVGLPKEDPEFVPPCMLLSGSIVLQEMVRNIINEVEATRKEVATQIHKGSLAFESMTRGSEYQQVFRLGALNRAAARLRPLFEAPNISPFAVFVELRELLADLAALELGVDPFESEPYKHDRLYFSFSDLTTKIRDLLTTAPQGSYRKADFTPDATGVPVARLTDDDFTLPNAYFLAIQTEKIPPATLAGFVQDPDKFKLMPLSLKNRAVRGVELKEERVAPMGLPSVGFHYFRVNQAGSPTSTARWGDIKNEKASAIVWMGRDLDWSGAKFTLYMTVSGGPKS